MRLLLALVLASVALTPGTSPAQSTPRRVIDVVAERFEFWPSEIVLQEGEQVDIRVTSDDTLHGFRIVGGGVDVAIPKRGKGAVVVTFAADKPGRYTFECSRMCGAGHSFMRGVLIVRQAGAR